MQTRMLVPSDRRTVSIRRAVAFGPCGSRNGQSSSDAEGFFNQVRHRRTAVRNGSSRPKRARRCNAVHVRACPTA